jgi:hypothetical protein
MTPRNFMAELMAADAATIDYIYAGLRRLGLQGYWCNGWDIVT